MERSSSNIIQKVPKRWESYSNIGRPIQSDSIKTPFIACRAPLKSEITSNLPKVYEFTPENLLAEVKEKGLRLGLVVDLSAPPDFYDRQKFLQHGVKYEKIPTLGERIPPAVVWRRFALVVDSFLAERSKDSDALIGVHCTHGVNRTGYLICKYLIDCIGVPAEEAINLFNECRGHRIEREPYLTHLRTGELPLEEQQTYHEMGYAVTYKGDTQDCSEPKNTIRSEKSKDKNHLHNNNIYDEDKKSS